MLGTTFNPYHWTIGQVVDLRIEGELAPVRIVGACYCFFNLAMDWSTYSSSLPNVQPTGYLVQLQPGTDANAYVKRVSTAESDFLYAQVNQQSNNSGSGVDIELILDGLVAALALILGATAALGVFNALLLTTRERVRDISILKALGMMPRQVSAMVISSACALGAAGAVLGLPAGIFLYYYLIDALARVAGFTLSGSALRGQLNPFQLIVVAAAGVAVAVVGATLPAR